MKAKFVWEDPFLLSGQLSDDERAIVEAAHTFCQEKLQTRVLMAARHEKFDREIMTPGCATCDADMLLSDAVSLMTGRRMHRLVVTEKDKPVGVISMTDVVRKIIG